VDVVAWAMAFVEVAVAAKVKKIELVDEAVSLEEIECAIDGDARDFGIDFLCAVEDFAGVEVATSGFHYLEKDAPLAGDANAARTEFALQTAGCFMDVDAFAG
jgi:hypothetical protein